MRVEVWRDDAGDVWLAGRMKAPDELDMTTTAKRDTAAWIAQRAAIEDAAEVVVVQQLRAHPVGAIIGARTPKRGGVAVNERLRLILFQLILSE